MVHVHANQPQTHLLVGPLQERAALPLVVIVRWSRVIVQSLRAEYKLEWAMRFPSGARVSGMKEGEGGEGQWSTGKSTTGEGSEGRDRLTSVEEKVTL